MVVGRGVALGVGEGDGVGSGAGSDVGAGSGVGGGVGTGEGVGLGEGVGVGEGEGDGDGVNDGDVRVGLGISLANGGVRGVVCGADTDFGFSQPAIAKIIEKVNIIISQLNNLILELDLPGFLMMYPPLLR